MPDPYLAGADGGLVIALLCRFYYTGLIKRYPWFCACLLAQACRVAIPFSFVPTGFKMTVLWGAASLILWTLQLLSVLEATSHVYEHFPGLGEIEKKISGWSFGVSLTIAICVSVYRWNPLTIDTSWMHSAMRIGWTIHIVCAGVLLIQLILCRLFANFPLSPNLLVHRRLGLIYFVFVSSIWAFNSNPEYRRIAMLTYYVVAIILLACWLTLMSPEKEYVPISSRLITKEEIEDLDRQIEGTDRLLKKLRDDL